MLHKTEIKYKPFELAETKYSTGRFHLMDVVVRRWSSLIQETLYERIGVMFDVSVQNVQQNPFTRTRTSICILQVFTHTHTRQYLSTRMAYFYHTML